MAEPFRWQHPSDAQAYPSGQSGAATGSQLNCTSGVGIAKHADESIAVNSNAMQRIKNEPRGEGDGRSLGENRERAAWHPR